MATPPRSAAPRSCSISRIAGTAITVHHLDLYRLGPGASIDVLDLDTLLLDGAAVIEWGGYADLSGFAVSTVSIAGGDRGDNQRVLSLERPAATHIVEAWASLSRAAAAR